jgi:hypothetical protein
VSGRTIAAIGATAEHEGVFVYNEPAAGWARVSGPAATLAASNFSPTGPIAINGADIFAVGTPSPICGCNHSIYVFHRPKRGWHGVVAPIAQLTYGFRTTSYQEELGSFIAASAHHVEVLEAHTTTSSEGSYFCPCVGGTWVFNKPATGWASTTSPQSKVLTHHAASAMAATDHTLFTDDGTNRIKLYKIQGG